MMQQRAASSTAGSRSAKTSSAKVVVTRRVPRAPRAANTDTLGFKTMRNGIKEASDETLLSPRFYTTDFEAMEELFDIRKNPNIRMDELEAACAEFANDYNQRHFVRNATFKPAADKISGDTRRIFIEFLERSCTAEFSGFLLYKEVGRRLKASNPVVAEIFTLMSRDEARHAGFINKAMSDFNLALDLGFLTKNRKYTFFKPEFIIWATYLSEKIGYWRYISIYRHLQRNPDNQLYPLFEYFENWCQDESRHGDFLAACLKALPQFVTPTLGTKLWCRFFCHSVYVTMYLNDHSRTSFYESLGLNTRLFNQHVILETNKSTERIFPEVPDCEHPSYFMRMDRLIDLSDKLRAIDRNAALPGALKAVAKAPIYERMAAEIFQLFIGPVKRTGSYDLASDPKALVY